MVVGPEDVDHQVVATLELGGVVRDVGRAVGGFAALLHEHGVVVLPELGGLQPEGAVGLVGEARVGQAVEHSLHGPVVVQGLLVGIAVHLNVEALQGGLDLGKDGLLGRLSERAEIRRVNQGVPVRLVEVLRNLHDILPEVAVLREVLRHLHGGPIVERPRRGGGRPGERLVAGAHRLREHPHLPPGVVVVVLACDVVAGPVEQVGDGVAEDRVAAVAHVERAGGIGAHVLHEGRLPGPHVRLSERVALGQEVGESVEQVVLCEPEIDKSGPGHLHAPDARRIDVLPQPLGEPLGNGPRVVAEHAGETEGRIRGEVAVLGAVRRLEFNLKVVRHVAQGVEHRADLGAEVILHGGVRCVERPDSEFPSYGSWRCSEMGIVPFRRVFVGATDRGAGSRPKGAESRPPLAALLCSAGPLHMEIIIWAA